MSAEEQLPSASVPDSIGTDSNTNVVDEKRSTMILKAKELYSRGSRNYLVKNYSTAVEDLSQVCELYDELYNTLCDELGMPYLLYAKSLIGLAIEESKVIDVPDEENDEEDEEDEEEEEDADNDDDNDNGEPESNANDINHTNGKTNGAQKDFDEKVIGTEKIADEADSTEAADEKPEVSASTEKVEVAKEKEQEKSIEDQLVVSSSDENSAKVHIDEEKPSTSNGESGDKKEDIGDEDEDSGSNLQLAWEVLELAAKIFKRQGISGLPNLAEVHAELGNIQFENNVLSAAREDYEKALKIYGELEGKYYRAMAEINYKIGLTYLLDGLNKEGAQSLKEACSLLDIEIENVKSKEEQTEKDENNVKDIEETKQEIWAKISEIEEMEAQQYAEVRAALDSYIKPISSNNGDGAGPSTSAAASSSSSSAITSSQPTNINHLIKRKKPEEPNSEAEAAESPAKRPAV